MLFFCIFHCIEEPYCKILIFTEKICSRHFRCWAGFHAHTRKKKDLGDLRKLGNFKKIPEIRGFDGEYPAVNPKAKFWRFLVKNCKKSAVKHSVEKPILLNFVNLSSTFCPRLYIWFSSINCVIVLKWPAHGAFRLDNAPSGIFSSQKPSFNKAKL